MPVIAKGLEGIVANSTSFSDVLGDKGILIYAGYDINELAGKVLRGSRLSALARALPNRPNSTNCKLDCAPSANFPRA